MDQEQIERERERAKLFEDAMVDEWEEVYKAYKEKAHLQTAKIDKSDDTVLHVAVLKGKTEAVKKLVNLVDAASEGIYDERRKRINKILGAKNESGNTPLHLAAALGIKDMCVSLTKACPEVIVETNNDKETPYFLSARHGKTDVFLLFHGICQREQLIRDKLEFLFRKDDGDTILHSAINGEFFELAYKIILTYYKDRKKLIEARDGHGRTPLHILAEKTHAFESGNPPGIFDWLLYQCIIVTVPEFHPDKPVESTNTETSESYPPNYETCMVVISIIKKQLELLRGNSKGKEKDDPEIGSLPSGGQGKPENHKPEPNQFAAELIGGSKKDMEMGTKSYPPNYETLVHLLKFIFKLLLVILGFGISEITKIADRKKQHHWANLVAKELIQADTTYQSQADGKNPLLSRPDALEFGDDDLKENYGAEGLSSHEEEATVKETPEYATILANMWVAMQARPISVEDLKKGLMEFVTKIGQDVSKFFAQYEIKSQEVDAPGKNPTKLALTLGKREARSSSVTETPFLVAARTGIVEIVEGLLKKYPTAIHDTDQNGKNALLLAVEHRQTHVFNLLQTDKIILKERLLRLVDNDGNSALHLAATCSDHHPRTPGAALRMQWEMQWFKYVKKAMPPEYVSRRNSEGQTPHEVLTSTHQELVSKAGEWMTKTSESCSVVAALIATVAFATSATVPGGVDQNTGEPTLRNQPLFHVFAISSLLALCFSVTAMVLFLTILTSRYQENDFATDLPRRLLLGLTTLFTSIAAILVSFCAGHFFLVQKSIQSFAYPIYAATCLPVTYFGLAQLPLYFDLLVSIFYSQPQASYRH